MKTEEHLEPTAVFIQRVTAAVSELKDYLRQDFERHDFNKFETDQSAFAACA